MISEIRIFILLILLCCVCKAFYGQEETHTFGYFEDGEALPEAIEGVVFQPDPEAEQLFMLFLESSVDLENWRNEGLQSYQVQEDGTIVVQGSEAIDRKFWRMRIMHPASQDRGEWLAVLQVSRGVESVTAKLTVRTNFHLYVENYVGHGLDGLPIPWEEPIEEEAAVNAAVESAVARMLELVEGTPPKEGDYFEVTRGF